MEVGKGGYPPVILDHNNSRESCCDNPMCTSHYMGKGKRRPTGAKKSTDRRPVVFNEGDFMPEDRVYVNQYQLSVKGCLPNKKVK